MTRTTRGVILVFGQSTEQTMLCGYAPAGVPAGVIAEVEARFGRQSELRRVQMDSVRWMIELAVRAGVQRIVLNGSFVTDRMEPNDVDCVRLLAVDDPRDTAASDEWIKGLPFLQLEEEIARNEAPQPVGREAARCLGNPAGYNSGDEAARDAGGC